MNERVETAGAISRRDAMKLVGAGAVAAVSGPAIDGLGQPSAANAAPVAVGPWVTLANVRSGHLLDVYGNSTADGTEIIQWTSTGGPNQQWLINDLGNGWAHIESVNSRKVLDVTGGQTHDGARVIQWPDNGGANQEWRLDDAGDGRLKIVSRHSGKLLSVVGSSTDPGAATEIRSDTNDQSQLWTATAAPSLQIKGGDVSTLKKNEDFGGVYYTSSGQRGDALAILKASGMNYARLKVWVNPADGYNNKARVLTMASRVKALGMKLLIDFHYSDSWADPGKQNKPAAWADLSLTELDAAVYDHTYDVLNGLKNQGTTADMVQIGNEIDGGMLWPTGSTSNWANLAQLLTSGSNAAKAASPSTQVMLHLSGGGNNSLFRWWFDEATTRGVPFDVIGASYYCYWHGSLADLQANLNDISSRYNKPVIVAETAYGFTLEQKDSEPNIFTSSLQQNGGHPATPQGQVDAFRAVINVLKAVPNGRGLGYFYWEPAWTAVAGAGWDPGDPSSGNAWENQALFDYNSGPLPGMAIFGQS